MAIRHSQGPCDDRRAAAGGRPIAAGDLALHLRQQGAEARLRDAGEVAPGLAVEVVAAVAVILTLVVYIWSPPRYTATVLSRTSMRSFHNTITGRA